ncbi:kinetochore-associated protein NSL1 homolog isoform X2 [Mugil cephalus]|uniref:kinetochore-associated protein NSL1 homolog isoform X2 n=1 Tax=Mugil cephalus TaxID=48193 RepID=UPI001FB5AC33|nr:kinetochore-associated protein NSL1 homolog isoform X2 [Mugil cephalus]
MEPVQSEASAGEKTTNQEFRVQVTSKREVIQQINEYKDLLRTALDGQPDVAEETKKMLLQELLENFEAAVQANVLVDGKPWEEAPDLEEDFEATDLESVLDDAIVETTRRRRVYPRQILPHAVHALKAERKIMGLYENTVKPQEIIKDPDQENIMLHLSSAAPEVVKEVDQVIKSINTLQKQARGLCEILSTKPSQTSAEIHREVLGSCGPSDAATGSQRHRQPIKRAAEEAAAAQCYVPPTKKPDGTVGE